MRLCFIYSPLLRVKFWQVFCGAARRFVPPVDGPQENRAAGRLPPDANGGR